MSDFLLNLARRSAGLAPMVRARAMPARGSDALDVESHPGAAGERPLPQAPAPLEIPRIAHVASVPHAIAETGSGTPLLRAPDAASDQTVRRAIAASGTPAVARAAAPRPAEQSVAAPFVTVRAAEAGVASSVLPAEPPPIASPAIRGDDAWTEALADEPGNGAPDAPVPRIARIEPMELPAAPAAAAPMLSMLSTPERTIHVKIGAIEIVGDDGRSPERGTLEQPSHVAEASRATGATPPAGFDDFAALRSYAPWTW